MIADGSIDAAAGTAPAGVAARRRWMGILARATEGEVEARWRDLPHQPAYSLLRRPEIGLAMVRARAGGTGPRFHLGEMTMTRCVVLLEKGGQVGYGFVAGRRVRQAELAALFDALLQDPDHAPAIAATVIEPLAEAERRRAQAVAARTAATKVEFFTLVRGD